MTMGLGEYQELASRTINQSLTDDEKALHALHLIASEVGEIHALYQKVYQGHPFDEEHLKKEIGDLLWGIAELCSVYGFSLGKIAEMNIEKLLKRYPSGFDADKSLNRKDGDV